MAFSHRIATLAAVVAIPLGIAATSYALTDSPQTPKVPPKVELDNSTSGTPSSPSPSATAGTKSPGADPSDEVVSRPPVDDDDDEDDDRDDG
ncbi:small hydrophilic protein [Streptomyces sp. TRM66268-LWL]|uniref:Small hydrophilic protein n=1 Tax=Streptomyces polyasparticus TaxID=2767826 RepID=A0ABR7S9Y6_9ACTN|nr:small hydrophilic protein [Streptomyces polyasparticus]MBC9712290.1 small hydrophilic protein [Streptomyces polyasparticus]